MTAASAIHPLPDGSCAAGRARILDSSGLYVCWPTLVDGATVVPGQVDGPGGARRTSGASPSVPAGRQR